MRISKEDLGHIKSEVVKQKNSFGFRVLVCGDTGCRASGSHSVKEALVKEVKKQKLTRHVDVVLSGCNGFCSVGPLMTIFPGGIFYQKLIPKDIPEIVQEHFISNRPVEKFMYVDLTSGRRIPAIDQIPYFTSQHLRVMKKMGNINPERIEEYIWQDGYVGAHHALCEMTPKEIIEHVKTSGLRGRGGGGFPSGLKWEFCAMAKGDVKYVLCNADEGDPGAFMDRAVMEATPHAVLEGMIVAAKAIGSRKGYIYCRAEYPLAINRLTLAIKQARDFGLLGKDIFGSGLDFDIEIYKGAGAFVCGEETALMRSIEGKRGVPRSRPPFPAIAGLWDKPTILNNVETYANIPQIMVEGGEIMSKIGTESSKGTKVFAVTGKVNNIGLVEVPMGTTVGHVIFDICGGVADGKKFKAAQLGGPSGGCLPAEHLNTPIDYEAIAKAGAIMGSGGMIVMDEDTCMVDMARYFMDFCQDESCGKCTPCRVGTRRMLEILERITHGDGREGDIELLETIATTIKDAALCGLGQTAPNPVLSTIRYFRHEYEEHIRHKRCRAGVCAHLFKSPCQNACPVGMDIPAYMGLVRANRLDDAYKVLKLTNPFPSICGRVCGHPCQDKCQRAKLDAPLAIKHVKRFIADNASHPRVQAIPASMPEKIAVVGAGPAGLTAALELKKRGYAVTVFEALPEPGGMLRYGIPAYRLPREVLKQEIQDILDTGVILKTSMRIGTGVPFEQLDREFNAIYMAPGAQASMPLGISGDNATGVIGAVEFLRDYHLGKKFDLKKPVAVIGGGNSAIDAARTAIRLGAPAVTIYYRRTLADMPALPEEIRAACEEGVYIETLVAPEKIVVKNGAVDGLVLTRMRLDKFDKSGRKHPVAIPDVRMTAAVGTVISAIGQSLAFEGMEKNLGFSTGGQTIHVDNSHKTANPKIWAGGDAITGPAMVIDAIAAGQMAARSIDMTLRSGKGLKPWEGPEEKIEVPWEIDAEVVETPQTAWSEEETSERNKDFREVELGYTLEMALGEARRCQRCDVKL